MTVEILTRTDGLQHAYLRVVLTFGQGARNPGKCLVRRR